MKFLTWLLSIAVGIFGAFVMTKLWGWFIVPFGIMQVTLWHMFGLSLFYNVLGTTTLDIKKAIVNTKMFKVGIMNVGEGDLPFMVVVMWLITWLTGYLIHLVM